MTWLDRFIQSRRMKAAGRFIKPTDRVLDVGCDDGALFKSVKCADDSVGIDPDLVPELRSDTRHFVKGLFPDDLRPEMRRPFDACAMLAVMEHIPPDAQKTLAVDIAGYLQPGGRVIITVPSPAVDHILYALRVLRLVHAATLEQHYGFDPARTAEPFEAAGLRLLHRSKFQLGLNNLFVLEKPR